VILTVAVVLVGVEAMAFLVPIVLMMIHVSKRMTVYLLPRRMQLYGRLADENLRSVADLLLKRAEPQRI
jgi:hypothetical protein